MDDVDRVQLLSDEQVVKGFREACAYRAEYQEIGEDVLAEFALGWIDALLDEHLRRAA